MFHKSTSNLITTADDSDDNKHTYGVDNPLPPADNNIRSISSSSGQQSVQQTQMVVVEIEKADIHQEKMFVRSKIPVVQPQPRRRKLSSADRDMSMDKGSKNDENEIIQLNSAVSVENKANLFANSRTNTVVDRADEETTFMYGDERKKSESSSLGSPEMVEVVNERSNSKPKRKIKSKERVRSSVEDLTSGNGLGSSTTSLSETETSQRKQTERAERRAKPAKRGKDNKRTNKSRRHSTAPTDYTYENIVGIYLHKTSALQFDRLVSSPKIRISFIDLKSGTCVVASDKERLTTDDGDGEAGEKRLENFTSNGGRLLNSSTFSFQWEELIVINDDINHVNRANVAVFFELFNDSMASEYRSCWAFLVLKPGKEVTHVDQKNELQLYRYQKVSKRAQKNGLPEVYNQWAMKRVEHVSHANKSTLKVTVKGLRVTNDGEKPEEHKNVKISEKQQRIKQRLEDYHLDSIKFNHDFGKLPGQSCRAPNKMIHRVAVAGKGCLAAKLSDCGELLAYSEITEAQSYIHILQIPEFQEVNLLFGHMQLIHDLNWGFASESSSTKYLISASSDCTAIVWVINRKEKAYKSVILPHPAFVYTNLILTVNHRHMVVVTGGRDQILRLWKVNLKTVKFELLQELESHSGYIATMVKSKNSQMIYSSDSTGVVYEWSFSGIGLKLLRRIEIPTVKGLAITKMLIHPRNNRIYVQTMGQSCVYVISVTTGSLVHFVGDANEKIALQSTMTVTPCGTLLLLVKQDQLLTFNATSGAFEQSIKLCGSLRCPKTVVSHIEYHPHDLYMMYSIYGRTGGSVNFLGYQSERLAVRPHRTTQRPDIFDVENTPFHEKQLDDIIRRLDHVFLTPYTGQAKDQGILNDIAGDAPSSSDTSVDSNKTFTIKADSKRRQKHTQQNRNQPNDNDDKRRHSSSDNKDGDGPRKSVVDLTYNVVAETKGVGVAGGTYSIDMDKKRQKESDDTTISESMDFERM